MAVVDRARLAAALPGYELGEVLGQGAYGMVLAARHVALDHPRAVKVLVGAASAAEEAQFAAEARILARLDHPHVVRVHDYVHVPGEAMHLIVMELLPGATLRARTAGGMPAEAACAVGLAVAAGLGCAHAAGILHRDVKPENILFGAGDTPKITDFGIAKLVEGSGTQASRPAGTWAYMAPEHSRPGGRVGAAADVYSLGVVVYELLAGATPFGPDLPPAQMLLHHLETPPPPLPGNAVPPPVAAVVLRALAKDPAHRQRCAGDLGLELAHAAADSFGFGWLARSGVGVHLDGDLRAELGPPPYRRASRAGFPTPAAGGAGATRRGTGAAPTSLPRAGHRATAGNARRDRLRRWRGARHWRAVIVSAVSVVLAAAVASALLVGFVGDSAEPGSAEPGPAEPGPAEPDPSAPAVGSPAATAGPVPSVVRDRHGINFWVPREVAVATALRPDHGVDVRVGFGWQGENQMRELGGDGHGLEVRVRLTRGFAPSGRASSSLGGYTEQPGGPAGSTVVTWGVEEADVFRPGQWYEAVFHLTAGADASTFFELTFVATSDSRRPGVPAADRMSADYAYAYLRAEDNTVNRVSAQGPRIPLNVLAEPGFEVPPGDPPDYYVFYWPGTGRKVTCSPAGSFSGACSLWYENPDPSGTSVRQEKKLSVVRGETLTAEAVVRCPPGLGNCMPNLTLWGHPKQGADNGRRSECTIPPDGKWYSIRLDLDHNFPADPGGRGYFEDDYTSITWELYLRGQVGRTMEVDQILLAKGGARAVDEPGNFDPPASAGGHCSPAPTR